MAVKKAAAHKEPARKYKKGEYRVLVGLNYPTGDDKKEVRREPGDIVDDLPPRSVHGLVEQGAIEPASTVHEDEDEEEGEEGFDPGEHTVADVIAYVEANPDERETVQESETAGKARATLLGALDSLDVTSTPDEAEVEG